MHKSANGAAATMTTAKRCAIYTRKSSEEGLDQDFNSLDAQREACEAYILSQKHEGWTCLSEMYDDGGISGATLERAALKRLLADIAAGRIDAVVVYKVDRLTRSLGDFAKIVEAFDKHSVSFVSVTQAFNTTTSMGRLTLNMLLSFAQFEREVTGERIRDKIAASKKKGMWMGGLPPLGYDAKDRKLVVNRCEADTVRHIYRRYAALGSVATLKRELDRDGIVSKVRIDRFGRSIGGKPLARGALYLMLQNRIYLGKIVHKDKSYPGLHQSIIDEDLWASVQETLAINRVSRAIGKGAAAPSLLAGIVYDDAGHRMTPSHANKKGTRYCYYVSQGLLQVGRRSAPFGRRVPAADIEGLVEDRLLQLLSNKADLYDAIEPHVGDISTRHQVIAGAADLTKRWYTVGPSERRSMILALVERVNVKPETLEITVRSGELAPVVLNGADLAAQHRSPTQDARNIRLSIPAKLKRAGLESRLIIDGADSSARRKPDHSLHRVLSQAHRYRAMVMRAGHKSIAELAAEAGVGGSYFTRVLRLSFLAPDIVKAILHDKHPIDLTAKRLVNEMRIPIGWDEQRTLLAIN